MAVNTFNSLIAKNKRNSFLLIALFITFMTIFGIIVGLVWSGGFKKPRKVRDYRSNKSRAIQLAQLDYAQRGIATDVHNGDLYLLDKSKLGISRRISLKKYGYDKNKPRYITKSGTAWGFAFMIAGIAAGFAFLYSMIAMFAGAPLLMSASGAHEITKADDLQLYNVVEEMCLAGGIPIPRIYIIDSPALNAFATGRNPENASIAITMGLRNKLTRDEMQAVMAHELSHVKHFDIRYSMLMAVLVGTVVLLSEVFLRSLWFGGGRRRSNDREGSGRIQAILIIVAILLAILAPILAKIIQLAMSRQREYLADAGAVKLTRNPDAMCNALLKLSTESNDIDLEQANKATAAMYTVDPYHHDLDIDKEKASLFDTHPPITARVKRIRQLL